MSKEDAENKLLSHPFWKTQNWVSIRATINSVYRAPFSHTSCKGNGVGAKILNEYCIGNTCAWHKDFAWKTTGLNSNQSHETISGCSKIS